MTREEAVENAARILRNVEGETNLQLMDQLIQVAQSWISIAELLDED